MDSQFLWLWFYEILLFGLLNGIIWGHTNIMISQKGVSFFSCCSQTWWHTILDSENDTCTTNKVCISCFLISDIIYYSYTDVLWCRWRDKFRETHCQWRIVFSVDCIRLYTLIWTPPYANTHTYTHTCTLDPKNYAHISRFYVCLFFIYWSYSCPLGWVYLDRGNHNTT